MECLALEPIMKRLRLKLKDDEISICLDGDVKLRQHITSLVWSIQDVDEYNISTDLVGRRVFENIAIIFYSDLRLKVELSTVQN